jgi:leucyl/phenylalanyl-tRNA--protein transferase
MKIFECAEGVDMSALFSRRRCRLPRPHVGIARAVDLRRDPSFAADAARELFSHFLARRPFVRATAAAQERRNRRQGEEMFHPARVEAPPRFAKRRIAHKGRPVIPPEVLLQGYRLGVFPMAMDDGAIEWFSPDPRGVIPLDAFHVPHALERVLRRGIFEVRINTAFEQVMRRCGERDDTWINDEIIQSYTALHRLGCAHSVETWQDGRIAGGLYGVSIGGAFFGESMFHNVTDASKVALCALVDRMRARRFTLLDTQWLTPHLRRFGGLEISRREYMYLLTRAVALRRSFVDT